MMPMSKQTWSEGEKYLAARILFIYMLVLLVYVFPFVSLHYYAKHRAPRTVIYEQYKKMVHTATREPLHASHAHHHKKPHSSEIIHSATRNKRS